MKLKKAVSLALCAVMAVAALSTGVQSRVEAADGDLTIDVIDLKKNSVKGDAVLLQSGGEYLLIDTGDKDDSNTVVNYLKAKGVDHLSVYISHFHSDHFGELNDISDNFTIDTLYVPLASVTGDAVKDAESQIGSGITQEEYNSTKNSYDKFYGDVGIKVKSQKGKYCQNFVEVSAGHSFSLGSATVTTIGTPSFKFDDFENDSTNDPGLTETKMEHYLNNMSLCTRITVPSGGKTISYLSCGDAEVEEENWLIGSGATIKSDIWKMNHHGVDTSNSAKFCKAVAAKHAVADHYVLASEITRQNKIYKKCKISMKETATTAKKCLYGLIRTRIPMERAEKYGEVYRTEFNGDVTFSISNGAITESSVSGFRKSGGKWYLYWNGKVVKPNSKGFITGYNDSVFKADKKGVLKKGMYKYKGKVWYCYGAHNDSVVGAGWIKYKGKKYYSPEYFPYLAQGWKKIGTKNYLFDEKTGVFIRKQKA